MRRILAVMSAVCAVVLACGDAGATASKDERQSYDLKLSPGGRVELKNLQGDILVERWDESRVVVDVNKRAEGDTEEDVREVFEAWALTVHETPDNVRLEADVPEGRLSGSSSRWSRWNGPDAEVWFDFKAKVPRDAVVEISSVNGQNLEVIGAGEGRVEANNVNGDIRYQGNSRIVELSAVNGTVTAEMETVAPNADVRLNAVNGSVLLYLPETAQARIQVSSLSGKLYSNLDLPKQTVESFIGFQYDAQLGTDGGRVELSTVHGPVRILRPGSAKGDGESLVTVTRKEIVIPEIDFEWDGKVSDEVREAVREASEAAREAAREAREAVREAQQEAREGVREAQQAIREAHREARDWSRDWNDDWNDEKGPFRMTGVISGDLEIRDSNESISVGHVEGNVSLVTFAGDIDIEAIGGDGKLLTYGGSISVGKAAKSLEAETYGGDVSVQEAAGTLVVKTKGGDIEVHGAALGLRAETLGGDIQLSNIDGPFSAKTNGGEIQARLRKPILTGEVLLESLGGDLGLVVPKGMGANVRVEIHVRRRDVNERFLDTNLTGLERTVETSGDGAKIIYAGAVFGGGPNVTLLTHGGEVSLRESP